MKFKCNECKSLLNTTKKIRKCPLCKSKSISLIVEEVPVIETQSSAPSESETTQDNGFITTIKRNDTNPVDNNGKRACKVQQVNVKQIKETPNLFESLDDLKNAFADETESFTKKVKFSVQPRGLRKFEFKQLTCNTCHRTFNINPAFAKEDWKCDNCIKNTIGK